MFKKLATIGTSPWYWSVILMLGLSLQGVALFYQYALDYGPCVLCIHVRIWVLGFILVALVAMFVCRTWWLAAIAHILTAIIAGVLLERAWLLLGTERGSILGDCSLDLGLPAWFALDQWFPKLFGVQEACGYTPKLMFGITMAEALIVIAVTLLLISMLFAVLTMSYRKTA